MVLKLCFPDYKILITPNSLIFNKEGQSGIMIDEKNFESLQAILRKIFCMKDGPMD
jgi:hypothetical protein